MVFWAPTKESSKTGPWRAKGRHRATPRSLWAPSPVPEPESQSTRTMRAAGLGFRIHSPSSLVTVIIPHVYPFLLILSFTYVLIAVLLGNVPFIPAPPIVAATIVMVVAINYHHFYDYCCYYYCCSYYSSYYYSYSHSYFYS